MTGERNNSKKATKPGGGRRRSGKAPAPSVDVQAFVVRSTDYRDSDRIVTLITNALGKVSVIARGARKAKRRQAGCLAPYSMLKVRLSGRVGHNRLWHLGDCRTIEAYPNIQASLPKLALAGYFSEVCRDSVAEHHPEPEVFQLLRQSFQLMQTGTPTRAMVRAFEMTLLRILGLAPNVTHCVGTIDQACGALLGPIVSGGETEPTGYSTPEQSGSADVRPYGFSTARGGLLCPDCARREPCIPLDDQAILAFQSIDRLSMAEAATMRPDLPETVNGQLRVALLDRILDLVGHPLKSVLFIEKLKLDKMKANMEQSDEGHKGANVPSQQAGQVPISADGAPSDDTDDTERPPSSQGGAS